MGLIAMSERDLQRIEVLSKVIAGRMTLVSAAHVLGLSTRQVRRLLERIRRDGAASIRHKAIGRPSNNRICDGVRDYALAIVRERYADFGPSLAAEKLAERDGLTVSRETLRTPGRRGMGRARLGNGTLVSHTAICHLSHARDNAKVMVAVSPFGRRSRSSSLPPWA
jgi:predicted ArsR family transcriptional regulator